MIIRRRLIEQLDDTAPGTLVHIVGRGGSGKTTLLQQWVAASTRRIAMVTMSPGTNDVEQVGRSITSALRSFGAELETFDTWAHTGEADLFGGLVPALVDLLQDQEVVLVIDDVHQLTSRRAAEFVKALADTWPPDCSLVLSGRERFRVRLVRSRFDAPVRLIGETDLQPNSAELAALFSSFPDAQAREALIEQTQGWPGGIRLDALATSVRSHALGGRPTLDQYLDYNVLGTLDDEELDYLGHVAAITPAGITIVDAALNRNDTASVLAGFLRRGLTMVEMTDPLNSMISIHAVLADRLTERLRSNNPERYRELLDRACTAAEQAGELGIAFELAARSGDVQRWRSMPYRHTVALIESGRRSLLRSWLERFPADEVASDPLLGLPFITSMRPRDERVMRRMIDRFDPNAVELPDGVLPSVAVYRLLATLGLAPVGRLDAEASQDWAPALSVRAAWELYADDQLAAAERRLLEVESLVAGHPQTNANRLAKLAVIALDTGRPDTAVELIKRARRILNELGSDLPGQFLLDAVAMKLAHLAGDLSEAEQQSRTVRRSLARLGDASTLSRIWALTAIGHLHLDLGFTSASVRVLHDEARSLALTRQHLGRLVTGLHSLAGRIDEADSEATSLRPRVALTTAELRVLQYLPSHFSVPRIANELNRSATTVKTHCVSIYRKLGVDNREDAVVAARRLGLVQEIPVRRPLTGN